MLWRMGESNVRTVQEALAASRPLAYTTVMTMLERLARKQLVSRRKTGRHFVYAALVERDVVRRHAVSNLVDALFEASPQQLLAFLTTNGGPPPAMAPAPVADSGDEDPGECDMDAVRR